MAMGNMIIRYVTKPTSSFRRKKHGTFSMNLERNLIVEGDSIQLKMVHMPSVQWCERLILSFLSAKFSWSDLSSRPVSYPIPNDGTVGEMIRKLGRHEFRPAHLHIRINVRDVSLYSLLQPIFFSLFRHQDMKSWSQIFISKDPILRRMPFLEWSHLWLS